MNYYCVAPAEPLVGDDDGVTQVRAYTVPAATPAAAIAPILIKSERVWCCLAGAMATPAGREAAPPVVGTFSAVAAPAGSTGFLGCCFDWSCSDGCGWAPWTGCAPLGCWSCWGVGASG